MNAMGRRETIENAMSSDSEDEEEADPAVPGKMAEIEEVDPALLAHCTHKSKPLVDRPDLSGDWQFSFEGNVHSWHINGTKAYTPDGADEQGEHLDIVEE